MFDGPEVVWWQILGGLFQGRFSSEFNYVNKLHDMPTFDWQQIIILGGNLWRFYILLVIVYSKHLDPFFAVWKDTLLPCESR